MNLVEISNKFVTPKNKNFDILGTLKFGSFDF